MLKEKKFANGDVVVFRTTDGTEVIAKVKSQNDEYLTVEKPCTIASAGNQGVQMIPAVLLGDADKPVNYNLDNVVYFAAPRQEAEKAYIESTSSIKVVGAGGVVSANQ